MLPHHVVPAAAHVPVSPVPHHPAAAPEVSSHHVAGGDHVAGAHQVAVGAEHVALLAAVAAAHVVHAAVHHPVAAHVHVAATAAHSAAAAPVTSAVVHSVEETVSIVEAIPEVSARGAQPAAAATAAVAGISAPDGPDAVHVAAAGAGVVAAVLVHAHLGASAIASAPATQSEPVSDLSKSTVVESATSVAGVVPDTEHAAVSAPPVHEASSTSPAAATSAPSPAAAHGLALLLGAPVAVSSAAVRAHASQHVQGVLGDLPWHAPSVDSTTPAPAAASAPVVATSDSETSKPKRISERLVHGQRFGRVVVPLLI